MKIINKYMAKSFTLTLLYCLLIFYMLFIIGDVIGHLDEMLKNKVPLNIMLNYYLYFFPLIFVQTAPLAALLATVYLLSNMNKNEELTAIKASGVSLPMTFLPLFVIGIMLGLAIFYVNENIAPQATLTTNKIKSRYIESQYDKKELKSIENLTMYGKANQMIYAKNFNSADNTLNDIIILEHDNKQNLKRKILAKKAVWMDTKWKFYNVIIYRFDEFAQPKGNVLSFDEKIIRLPERPSELLKGEFVSTYMNYPQLKTYIERLKGGDNKTINRLKTDLYFKLSIPFCAIIMIMLGIPFALTTVRGGVASSMGISILAGLAYYGVIGVGLALGKGGYMPPLAAAYFSNIVFFIISLVLIKRAPM